MLESGGSPYHLAARCINNVVQMQPAVIHRPIHALAQSIAQQRRATAKALHRPTRCSIWQLRERYLTLLLSNRDGVGFMLHSLLHQTTPVSTVCFFCLWGEEGCSLNGYSRGSPSLHLVHG